MRALLEDEIEAMLPDDWLSGIQAAEESEREFLSQLGAGRHRGRAMNAETVARALGGTPGVPTAGGRPSAPLTRAARPASG